MGIKLPDIKPQIAPTLGTWSQSVRTIHPVRSLLRIWIYCAER